MGIGSGLKSPSEPRVLLLITSGRPEKNMPLASPVAMVGTIVFVTRSFPPRSAMIVGMLFGRCAIWTSRSTGLNAAQDESAMRRARVQRDIAKSAPDGEGMRGRDEIEVRFRDEAMSCGDGAEPEPDPLPTYCTDTTDTQTDRSHQVITHETPNPQCYSQGSSSAHRTPDKPPRGRAARNEISRSKLVYTYR